MGKLETQEVDTREKKHFKTGVAFVGNKPRLSPAKTKKGNFPRQTAK